MAAEDDDLVTIVDVTDPNDPSYGDIRTRRRPLTDAELALLKPTLEKIGAYKFFSMEFNFADGPAVKDFIDSVEIQEYKRTKQRKIVQESLKGIVAGREVSIDSELIERTFGLVDDGENVSKPKGETNGLHAFYIKPKYLPLCQNYRGVSLKLFKSEYSYFVNMAHQLQTYCCGGPKEGHITLTQYRAVDLMIRGKPVNWNRYLLQNFQDKLRKYKAGPCPLYFGGTLTALIYKALSIDYNLINKPMMISPETPERGPGQESDGDRTPRSKKSASTGKIMGGKGRDEQKREVRTAGAMTRSQKILATESLGSESLEMEVELPSSQARRGKSVQAGKKRKAGSEKRKEPAPAAKKPKSVKVDVFEDVHTDEEHESAPGASPVESSPFGKGALLRRASASKGRDEEFVVSGKPSRLSGLYSRATATGSASEMESTDDVSLTGSKNLWERYEQFNALQSEFQLEHIVAKQMLEQAIERVAELEEAVKNRDERVAELEASIGNLEKELDALRPLNVDAAAPLKVRMKMQGKVSEGDGGEQTEDVAAAREEAPLEKPSFEEEHEEQAGKDTDNNLHEVDVENE